MLCGRGRESCQVSSSPHHGNCRGMLTSARRGFAAMFETSASPFGVFVRGRAAAPPDAADGVVNSVASKLMLETREE